PTLDVQGADDRRSGNSPSRGSRGQNRRIPAADGFDDEMVVVLGAGGPERDLRPEAGESRPRRPAFGDVGGGGVEGADSPGSVAPNAQNRVVAIGTLDVQQRLTGRLWLAESIVAQVRNLAFVGAREEAVLHSDGGIE